MEFRPKEVPSGLEGRGCTDSQEPWEEKPQLLSARALLFTVASPPAASLLLHLFQVPSLSEPPMPSALTRFLLAKQ